MLRMSGLKPPDIRGGFILDIEWHLLDVKAAKSNASDMLGTACKGE